MAGQITVVGLLLVLGCWIGYGFLRGKRSSSAEIFSLFGLTDRCFRLVSTDLGGRKPRYRFRIRNLIGDADSIFNERVNENHYVVGEFKGRKFRGKVRVYEYYQLQLYMGCLLMQKPGRDVTVRGVLGYKDHCINVPFDRKCFERLCELERTEFRCLKSKRKLFAKKLQPLHQRGRVKLVLDGAELV